MIKFDNVSFGYKNKPIFKDLNLSINDGECICLFAPSGFGKTTLLRLVMGIEKPSGGEIVGIDKKISVVFQEDRLLPHKTVRQNIELFNDNADIDKILSDIGLENIGELYPSALSGGMARRAALARALAREADIYILDEPFNGIDAQNVKLTAECIKKYIRGKITLLVTHDKNQAELLDARVIDLGGTL